MKPTYLLPNDSEAVGVLSMLYGDVSVRKADGAVDPKSASLFGLYVDEENRPVAACVVDKEFAAYAGAALSMIPKGGAEDAAETGDIPQSMQENVYEVMNICSRLLMGDDTPHLRLSQMLPAYDQLPEDARQLLEQPAAERAFEVEVPNYGKGRMALIVS